MNVLLVGPALFLRLLTLLCRLMGSPRLVDWLRRRDLFLETDLSRVIAELVMSEVLGLRNAGDPSPAS